MTRRHANNLMQGKQTIFGAKYVNVENIIAKAEWISNMGKELKELEEWPKVKLHINSLRTTLKIPNWKTLGHDGIHGFWLKKNHLH